MVHVPAEVRLRLSSGMIDRQLVTAALAPLAIADIDGLVEALQRPPRAAIRLRPGVAPDELPFEVDPVAWHRRGFFLPPQVRPGAYLGFAAADYYIQDASSLLALSLLDAAPGERICDLCASPGGKSTAILEDLHHAGWLFANEVVQTRLGVLEFNLSRHGGSRYFVSRLDPGELGERLDSTFDAVLVDAPCSGQSLIGRGKQTAAAFATRTIDHCAARQVRILDEAARLVRPGGRLVYSTCTFAFAENEGQIESFLQRHPDWILDPVDAAISWQSERGAGHYRLWPHRELCGGAFAARLRRGTDSLVNGSSERDRSEAVVRLGLWPDGFAEWGELCEAEIYRSGLRSFAWPSPVDRKLLGVATSWPEIGFRKGTTWFPAYALAMRRDVHWRPGRRISLDDVQATQYVQGHSIPGRERGWAIATWRGRPLGWLKGDGRHLKNHLPKPGRLPNSGRPPSSQ